MKLKKIKTFNFKLIKLEIIKSKIYLQKNMLLNNTSILLNKLEVIELALKRALHVIYSYHINNQKICFVGVPKNSHNFFSKILSKTNHVFIPENIWANGILSNQISIFKYIKKNETDILRLLLQLKVKPNLIVLFNNKSSSNILQETKNLRIPIIILNIKESPDFNFLFEIPGDFRFVHKKLNNLFFVLLNSILKK